MNAELRIVNLVDRGLQLRAEIATREAELGAIEAAMVCLARDGEKVDLAAKAGKTYTWDHFTEAAEIVRKMALTSKELEDERKAAEAARKAGGK